MVLIEFPFPSITLIVNRALPDWLSFHPHKWWIHVRNVYIPMSYLYGVRYQMEENDLILSLREVRNLNLPSFLPTKSSVQGIIPGEFLFHQLACSTE